MTRLDVDTLGALLEQAAALPPETRAAFVVAACDGNHELRAELNSLLSAHDAASAYFERLTEQIIGPAFVALADDPSHEFAIGQTVRHYRLLEELGGGGMGVVFKALDLRLDRFVALKFLAPLLNSDPRARDRLIAEAKAASALDHPNIGVVHDITETNDGRFFIVMGYYEGETLAQRRLHGRLACREAIDIVAQVASALTAAHQKGIVHRDVKPSNILVTRDGTAKLLDFGIATLELSEPSRGGAASGTLAYMSPEQTRGVPVDHRTDLWSLGVVLYEIITGVRPFRAEDDAALVRAIRDQEPHPPDRLAGTISPQLARVLARCLAKDAGGRYRDAQQLLADLRAVETAQCLVKRPISRTTRTAVPVYVGIGALVVVIGAVGIDVPRHPTDVTPTQRIEAIESRVSRLAVLPLQSVSAEAQASSLADGITDELIAQLSTIGELRVTARSSVTQYQNSRQSAAEIGRALRADALLRGTLRITTEGLHITMQLVESSRQRVLWTEKYTAAVSTHHRIPRIIALHVAGALGVKGQRATLGRVAQAGTTSIDAYLLFLKARHVMEKRTVESVTRAKEYFEHALDLDPAYARAWVGLGNAFSGLTSLAALRAADGYRRSRAAAERALEIDPDLAEAHVCLATALSNYDWDFERAAHHYRRALVLNPSYADAHRLYAEHLRFEGRFDEALREARQAEALDPLSPASQIVAGTILYWARRYDEAIDEYRRILHVSPGFGYAYFFLALAHIQTHEYEKARAALSVPGAGSNVQQIVLRGYIDAVVGRQLEARQALHRLRNPSREQSVSPWHFALIHVALGERDRAMDMLEQAYRARDWQLRMLPLEPLLDPLRSDRRFRALVSKVRKPRSLS